jgi:hypothetical protein
MSDLHQKIGVQNPEVLAAVEEAARKNNLNLTVEALNFLTGALI